MWHSVISKRAAITVVSVRLRERVHLWYFLAMTHFPWAPWWGFSCEWMREPRCLYKKRANTFSVAVSLFLCLGTPPPWGPSHLSPLAEDAGSSPPPQTRTKEASLVICSSLSWLERRKHFIWTVTADVFVQRGKDRKAVEMGEMRTWSCSVSAAPAGLVRTASTWPWFLCGLVTRECLLTPAGSLFSWPSLASANLTGHFMGVWVDCLMSGHVCVSATGWVCVRGGACQWKSVLSQKGLMRCVTFVMQDSTKWVTFFKISPLPYWWPPVAVISSVLVFSPLGGWEQTPISPHCEVRRGLEITRDQCCVVGVWPGRSGEGLLAPCRGGNRLCISL